MLKPENHLNNYLSEYPGEPETLNSNFDSLEKLKLLTFRVYESKLQNIWRTFEENNISPILIKGWAAAQNYPRPYLRRFGDFDIAVDSPDFKKAFKLQNDYNFEEVDLHCGLTKMDNARWNELYNCSVKIKCGNREIRILNPEDHLRLMCVHWLKDGGRDKERLWDIYYAVARRSSEFDWNRCLDFNGLRRRKWIIYTIALAHKYLGLDIEDAPFSSEAEKLPDWMSKAVEKEWRNSVEFRYLENCIESPGSFISQLSKRLPPNPIQSTVNMEGDFDTRLRFLYQTGDLFNRFIPSLQRVLKNIREKVFATS